MKSIDDYIYEVLHLKSDNKDLDTKSDVTKFIDSVEGDYQKRVVKLLDKAIKHIKENPTVTCFIVKSILKRDGVELPEYKWAESKSGKTFNIGDKTPRGSEVVYVVTDKTEIPTWYVSLYLEEGLVSEKLHLKGDNKDLKAVAEIDAFVGQFTDEDEKKQAINILNGCISLVQKRRGKHPSNENICYVVKTKDKEHPIKWDMYYNGNNYNVGDTTQYGSKILYVVTEETEEIPEKYKKYIDKKKYPLW